MRDQLYKSDNVLAPSELITTILGIFLIQPRTSRRGVPERDANPTYLCSAVGILPPKKDSGLGGPLTKGE